MGDTALAFAWASLNVISWQPHMHLEQEDLPTLEGKLAVWQEIHTKGRWARATPRAGD